MTVVVAARTKTGVILAADTQQMRGWMTEHRAHPKVWASGKWACGVAGTVRAAQLVQYHATLPKYRPDEHDNWERFAVTEVVPAVRAALADKGHVRTDAGRESIHAELLLANTDQIVTVASDYAVVTDRLDRQAIGSGAPEALGFLGDTGPWTQRDVVEAVRRAALTNAGVGGPIHVVDTVHLAVTEVPA